LRESPSSEAKVSDKVTQETGKDVTINFELRETELPHEVSTIFEFPRSLEGIRAVPANRTARVEDSRVGILAINVQLDQHGVTYAEPRREAIFDFEVVTRRSFDEFSNLVIRRLIIVVDVLLQRSALDEYFDFEFRKRFGDRHLEDGGGLKTETSG